MHQSHPPESDPAALQPEPAPVDSQNQETGGLHTSGIPGGYRELLTIAIPLIISSGTQSLMHIIDRVFVTWLSKEALAAALPSGILFWSFLSLPFGVVSYTNAMVAQYDGAKQKERVSQCVWQSSYVAIFSGLVLMHSAIFAEALFGFIQHEPEVRKLEVEYFFWLCIGAIPALLPVALSTFFSGRGRTNLVLAVNVAGLCVNAVLDYVMIFGWGPFPRWGMAGAAIATDIAEVFVTVSYIALLLCDEPRLKYSFWKNWKPQWLLMKDLFKFGGTSGLQMFLDVAGFTAFMMIIGQIGVDELAATNIAFNLNTLAFIPVIGVGIAVSTLVGQRIGEGRPEVADQSARKGFVVAGGIMLLFGAIYVFAPQLLLIPYSFGAITDEDREEFAKVANVVVILLRFVAIYSFFDAMAIIFGSAIRSAGDTVFSMIVTFLCAFGLLVAPTYVTWKFFDLSESQLLMWSWIWCSIYVSTLGLVYLARFLGGRWKSMSVIEPAQPKIPA